MAEIPEVGEAENDTGRNLLILQGVAAGCEPLRADDSSSPTRTRTWNKPVNRTSFIPAEMHQKSRVCMGLYPFITRLQAPVFACVELREFSVLPGGIR